MESTQPTFKEEWTVTVGKEVFVLDEKQIKVLREASLEGSRSMVWFSDFAISIPHIQTCVQTRKWNPNQLEAPVTPDLPEEQRQHNLERIKDMKQLFGK